MMMKRLVPASHTLIAMLFTGGLGLLFGALWERSTIPSPPSSVHAEWYISAAECLTDLDECRKEHDSALDSASEDLDECDEKLFEADKDIEDLRYDFQYCPDPPYKDIGERNDLIAFEQCTYDLERQQRAVGVAVEHIMRLEEIIKATCGGAR